MDTTTTRDKEYEDKELTPMFKALGTKDNGDILVVQDVDYFYVLPKCIVDALLTAPIDDKQCFDKFVRTQRRHGFVNGESTVQHAIRNALGI